MLTRSCARTRSATALRVRKVRRVTRRANDDDTLISPGGRGSFFKGQRGERAVERATERGGRRNEKPESDEKEEVKKKKRRRTTTTTTMTATKSTTTTKFPPRASAEANVRNDS